MNPLDTIKYGAIAVLAVLAILFYNLYRGAVNDLATYRAEVEAAQEQVRLDNERKINELVAVNVRLESGWNDAVRALRDRPTIRVRPNSCPRTVPAVPANAGEPTQLPVEESRSGAEVSVAECETRLNVAIEDAAVIEWMKHWEASAHEATK